MPQISYSGKGSASANPSITTRGLIAYLDPSNRRGYLSAGSFKNLVNTNSYNAFTEILSSDNGKVSFFNFNESRNLLGTNTTNLTSLTSCCIQVWARNTQDESEAFTVNNYISIAGRNSTRNTPGNLSIFNFTITTELTSINYNNFYNNTTNVPINQDTDSGKKENNKFLLADSNPNTTLNGSHFYFVPPVLFQDLRENNINWEIYFQSAFWNVSGSTTGDALCLTVAINSQFGQSGTGATRNVGVNNSFAISYDSALNSISLFVQGNNTPVAQASLPFEVYTTSGETSNIIYNWIDYNKTTKNLSIFISQANLKPVTPLLVVPNFEPYAYLKPPKPPYIRDIVVSRFSPTSAFGINYSRYGNIGFSLGADTISSELDALSGEWNLLTLNFERDRIRLFKNLKFIQTIKLQNRFNLNTINIGDTNNVDVGQVLIYNRELTDEDIVNNYKNFVYRYNIDNKNVDNILRFVPLDPDTEEYVNRTGLTNYREIYSLNSFIVGLKNLNLYDKINCWPLIQGQNIDSGSTVYSFGSAFPNVPGTITGTFTRSTSGISLPNNSFINTNSPGITGTRDRSIMMIVNDTPNPSFLGQRFMGGWGNPGKEYNLFKNSVNSIKQDYFVYDLTEISSGRGVGASYGGGEGITWSNNDVSIEVIPDENFINVAPSNFLINTNYNGVPTNNETYSFVLKSTAKLTENDFFNIYNLYKATLGRNIFLPTANTPIDFDNDTLLYLARLGEPKEYRFKNGLNNFIKYLKINNWWNDYVYFLLGRDTNTSTGVFHSLGNYAPGVNHTASIIGTGAVRNSNGLYLSTTSYLSTDVPATTGNGNRFIMVHHDNTNFPGFLVGEGINGTNQAFGFKRQVGGTIILDAWFNWSNNLPTGAFTAIDLNQNRYVYSKGPATEYYYGYIADIDTKPGNLVLNQGNVGYNAERSFGNYYFLVKAKKSVMFPQSNGANNGIVGLFYSFINLLNPNPHALPWSRPLPDNLLQPGVLEYATLSGMYLTYDDYRRLNRFSNSIGSLYNNMVCWPLRQGQNAGGVRVGRFTHNTVYSFGGLPQASAVRIGPTTENSSGAFYTSSSQDASGRIVTTGRRLSSYSERTLYAAANINSHNFFRRSRLMYTTWSEPSFIEFGGSSQNGLILEGFGFGSQMCNTLTPFTSGNIATVNISSPAFNTFNTFGTIYSGSRISQYRNRVILGSAGEEQYAFRPNTPGWASTLTDARQLTLMNSEDEPLPFGGSMIGSLAFAADFNIALTTEQLTAFDDAYRTTLGEGITFQ